MGTPCVTEAQVDEPSGQALEVTMDPEEAREAAGAGIEHQVASCRGLQDLARASRLAASRQRRASTPEMPLRVCDTSGAVMSALKDLRRAGRTPGQARRDLAALLERTLEDCHDTAESQRQRLCELRSAHEASCDLGSARRATVMVSQRTIAVVERKMQLLQELSERIAAYRAAAAVRQELLEASVCGSELGDVAKGAAGFGKLVRRSVHSGPPREADRGLFSRFAASFGLPAQHEAVLEAKRLLAEEGAAWAAAASQRAEALSAAWLAHCEPSSPGSGKLVPCTDEPELEDPSLAIQRMIELVVCMSVPKDDPQLAQAWQLALDSRTAALKLLLAAAWERVELSASRGDRGEVATEAANAMDEAIGVAAAFGVPRTMLVDASKGAVELRVEGAWRVAVSQVEYSKGRSIAVCQASAQRMDTALAAAISKGVPQDHPRLKEVRTLMGKVRGEAVRMTRRERQLQLSTAAADAGDAATPIAVASAAVATRRAGG